MRSWSCLLVATLILGACGDDGAVSDPVDPGADASEAAAAAANGATTGDDAVTATTTTEPGPLDPTEIPGEPINPYNLSIADCFDQLEDRRDGEPVTITTKLPCDEAHHFEVFARLTYPAEHPAVFPGDKAIRDYALQACYREFTPWAASEYETSALDIGVIIPNQQNFENDAARYRGIHCWVERIDGEAMVGTSRDSGW